MAFEEKWTEPDAIRPTPVVVDRQYDWVSFYARFANRFEGFTKSEDNRTAVHAFGLECDADSKVWLKIKESAVDIQDEEWRGIDKGGKGWEGFHTRRKAFPS
jgi:hypothetical protein